MNTDYRTPVNLTITCFRLGPDAPKVNGEVEDEDMEEDNLSEEESIECPKPPVNEQVKKGRLLLKQ